MLDVYYANALLGTTHCISTMYLILVTRPKFEDLSKGVVEHSYTETASVSNFICTVHIMYQHEKIVVSIHYMYFNTHACRNFSVNRGVGLQYMVGV